MKINRRTFSQGTMATALVAAISPQALAAPTYTAKQHIEELEALGFFVVTNHGHLYIGFPDAVDSRLVGS